MKFLYQRDFLAVLSQVSDGEFANAVTFNTQLASLESDNSLAGKQNLADVDPVSGTAIANSQREHNSAASFIGKSVNTAKDNLPAWTNNDVGLSTDDLKTRDEALTLAFNTSVGHAHDGSLGAGKNIDAADLDSFNNYIAVLQTFEKTAASGTSVIVTTQLTGKVAGGGVATVGVYTTAPDNRVQLLHLPDETTIEDSGGQIVFGRLTEAAGVFTLSFFTNEAGVETAHSLSSQDIRVYFSEVYTMGTRPTRGADAGMLPSLDLTVDILDASATTRGVVSIGVQTFAGAKTFTGAISASNLSGTNSGDVTLAAIGAVPNANGASLSTQVLTLQPADSTFGGVLTAIAQSILGLKTFISGVVAQTVFRTEGKVETDSENDATSGSGVTLSLPSKEVVRLTNASLVSVAGITAPANKQKLILINRTTVAILIIDDATATAANRFLTGTGADLTLEVDASITLVYDTTTARWEIVGGSGSGGGGALIVYATESIAAAGTVTASVAQRELRRVQGNGAAQIANTTTPITAGTIEGMELILKGMHDTNTLQISNSGNVTLNGDMILYAGSILSLVWIDSKWLEVARKI